MASNIESSWSDERVSTMRRMWSEGFSASVIAAELGGGVTRSAVCGKLNRLGLSRPHSTVQKTRKPRSSNRPLGRRKVTRNIITSIVARGNRQDVGLDDALAATPVDDLAIPADQRRTVLQLTNETCRWPIGDPDKHGFYFCGALTANLEQQRPYCPGHAMRAVASVRSPPLQEAPLQRPWMMARSE